MDIRTKGSSTTNRRRKLWINRVRGQQEIQDFDREEAALEGHMTEIVKVMLNIHQGNKKRRRKTRKKTITEANQEVRISEQKATQEENGKKEANQMLTIKKK